MVASVSTDWTILINEQANTATAALPGSFSAGTNRLLQVVVMMYNGSGNTTPPTSCVANSVSAALILTDPAGQTRVSAAWFQFYEADLATIAGQTLTTAGGTGTKTVIYRLLQDAKQALPPATNKSYLSSNGTQTMPLARLANSYTSGISFTSVSATSLTQTNPARTNTVTMTSTRRMSYGNQNDTANTSDYVVAGQGFTTSMVINIEAAPTQTVVNINGGDDIVIGQSAVPATLTGFTGVPVVTSTSQHAITAAGGTANSPLFNVTDRIEGGLGDSLPFEALFTFTNGAESAQASQGITYKATEVKIVFTAPIKVNPDYLAYHMEANGHDTDNAEFYYIPYEDLQVQTDSSINVTNAGTFTGWLRPTEGPTAGRTYFYQVNVAAGGSIISVSGITQSGLISRGLASSGLTSRGL